MKNYIQKKVFFDKYFLIVHISLNFVVINLRFVVAVDDINSERTVSCLRILF